MATVRTFSVPSFSIPLFLVPVAAGFPSPADDHAESPIKLHEHLMPNPASTFIFRIEGRGWPDAGIAEGNRVIVDRSITPVNGSLVVADIEGDRLICRVRMNGVRLVLIDGAGATFNGDEEGTIWGVVTSIIRFLR